MYLYSFAIGGKKGIVEFMLLVLFVTASIAFLFISNSPYRIVDRINLYYEADDFVKQSIIDFEEFIKKETLAISIEKSENVDKELDLNGHNIKIKIERR